MQSIPNQMRELARMTGLDAVAEQLRQLADELEGQPSAVPHGWRLVPETPTKEMIKAGTWGEFYEESSNIHDANPADVEEAYRAMLEAAPQPPAVKPLTADRAPFRPDWMNYKKGFSDGLAERDPPPPEPTPEMIEAGAQALVQWEDGSVWPDSWGSDAGRHRRDARKVWMAMCEAARSTAEPVKYGCHCDLEPGMEPDGCVLDEGKPENCVYARRQLRDGKTRDDCEYWQPIKIVKE